MREYSLTHVRDEVLLRNTQTLIAEERGTMAFVLAHLAEIDARKLYAPLGYPSMFAYCVEELRFSEDSAKKRIQAARIARQYPILFTELAEGRLHVTAICVLAPHLTEENVLEIVRAAAHRRQSEIYDLLRVCTPASDGAQGVLAPEPTSADTEGAVQHLGLTFGQHAVQQVGASGSAGLAHARGAAQHVGAGSLSSQVEELVPLMVRPEIKDRVRYLQALLSHALPSGDVSKVLARALDLLADEVEKRRFGTGNGSRRRRTGARNRYIPSAVRHAVWNRDEGRCTFVGENEHRCGSNMYLEFDHVDPRNREDTVAGLRLRCNTHNQHEAERIFGTEFMKRKREEARQAAAKKRAEAQAQSKAKDPQVEEQIQDVLSALRGLGIRGDQARRAAEQARKVENATLVDRIRAALQFHGECISRSPKMVRALHSSE